MTRSEELLQIAQDWEEQGREVDVMYDFGSDFQVVLEIHSDGEFIWNTEADEEISELRHNGTYSEEALWSQ